MRIDSAPVVDPATDPAAPRTQTDPGPRHARAASGPATPEQWDDVAAEWGRKRPERLWRRHADRINGEWVARNLPGQVVDRLLKTDLFDEAASGGLYEYFKGRARLTAGVDLSLLTTRAAGRNVAGLVVTCADVLSLPFADETFDVIVSNSTLDHFETEEEFLRSLRELRRVLRSGGELLLTLDNRANPIVAVRNALPIRWLRALRILSFYIGFTCGPAGLRRRLVDTGWTVAEMGAIMHCPRLPAMFLAALFNRLAGAALQNRYLGWLHGFETLARLPTCYLTGYFITVRATRAEGDRHAD